MLKIKLLACVVWVASGFYSLPALADYQCSAPFGQDKTWTFSTTPLKPINSVGIGESYGIVATASPSGSTRCATDNPGPTNYLASLSYFGATGSAGAADPNSRLWPSGIPGVSLRVKVRFDNKEGMPKERYAPDFYGVNNNLLIDRSFCNDDSRVGTTCNFQSIGEQWVVEAINVGYTNPAQAVWGSFPIVGYHNHRDTYRNSQGGVQYVNEGRQPDNRTYVYRITGGSGSLPLFVDTTCNVDTGSENFTVKLDPVRVSDFTGKNSAPGAKKFSIFANCSGAGGNLLYSFSDANHSKVPYLPYGLLGPTAASTASNVAIHLSKADCSTEVMTTGTSMLAVTVPSGTQRVNIELCARYYQYSTNQPTAGTVQGQTTFMLKYQ